MSENPEVRALVNRLEAAVEAQYPQFERCSPEDYAVRLDVTLKASIAMMSATFAAFLRFHGMDKAPTLFQLAISNLQRLTAINLQHPVTNDPDTPPDAPAPSRLH